MIFLFACMASAAPKPVTVTVTPDQRDAIHSRVDDLQNVLLNIMLTGATYDSISYGSGGAAGSPARPTTYPFRVVNTTQNRDEGDRKEAKYTWAYNTAIGLGFPRVVRYQPDKFFYAEIGDADAPEMIFALSHLDSPTQSINPPNTARWRDQSGRTVEEGADTAAYKTPYIRDGWIYGAGVQDDSGPTLATLVAMKAIMEANLPLDRRIRVGMGAYEDSNPGIPYASNLVKYMDIPYFPATSPTATNSSFYDNWAYKFLNREEMPIAAFTSDSRFPVIQGNSGSANRTISLNLATDEGLAFRLESAGMQVTEREGDPTLRDIVGGSGVFVPSRAEFAISVQYASSPVADEFKRTMQNEVNARGWGDRVVLANATVDDVPCITIRINTDVAMEAPTPQYGKNAVTWGMHLISKGFEPLTPGVHYDADLLLKKLADCIDALFMPGGVEDYYGTAMGLGERNPDSLSPLMTISLGVIDGTGYDLSSIYNRDTGIFRITLYMRHMYPDVDAYQTAQTKITDAFTDRGLTINEISPTAFPAPTLYLKHDNILTAIQMASYRNSLEDPTFTDVAALLDHSYPQGTTGGTLASDYWNKMNAFGAVLPGNERWWHAANERMTIKSAVQMTKLFADGMVEMARYRGPGGARVMWADIPGYNADRADLDLLDVVLDTYRDASSEVSASMTGSDNILAAATAFNIPMLASRFSSGRNDAAIASGHGPNGIYLPVESLGDDTFVLPIRLEFKLTKSGLNVSDETWTTLKQSALSELLSSFEFAILRNGVVTSLDVPPGGNVDKFFYKRISATDPDSLYMSVNLAITDEDGDAAVTTILADSRTDLYRLNPTYLESNPDPWPLRTAAHEERGFFLFPDGARDAEFSSPTAIFLTAASSIAGSRPDAPSTPDVPTPDTPPTEPTPPTPPTEPVDPATPVPFEPEEIPEIFTGGELPSGATVDADGNYMPQSQGKAFVDEGVLLDENRLANWSIIEFSPRSGNGWTGQITNGQLVVTFDNTVADAIITVTLRRANLASMGIYAQADTETRTLKVKFSGTTSSAEIPEEPSASGGGGGGCDTGAGFGAFLLFAAAGVTLRRRG
jgi:hypothetical protein